jgi:hypothetical protein
MFVGISISNNANRIANSEIGVYILAVLESTGISDNIAVVRILDNPIFPDSRTGFFGPICITNITEELCHHFALSAEISWWRG